MYYINLILTVGKTWIKWWDLKAIQTKLQKIAFESDEQIADTKDNNQLIYVDKYGFIEFDDRYPSVTAK